MGATQAGDELEPRSSVRFGLQSLAHKLVGDYSLLALRVCSHLILLPDPPMCSHPDYTYWVCFCWEMFKFAFQFAFAKSPERSGNTGVRPEHWILAHGVTMSGIAVDTDKEMHRTSGKQSRASIQTHYRQFTAATG